MNEQLIQLTKPVSPVFIETKPKARRNLTFVGHANVTQLLLAAVGPYSWEKVPGSDLFDGEGNLEAQVWRLTVEIDGKEVSVESTGDYDNMKGKSQGFRAQVCEGNAYRRAASKIGVFLEGWVDGASKSGMYVIHEHLKSLNGKDLRHDP